jgi:hypothetical protein
MEKKKQRIISVVIGLVLASLLIYIGVRIIQQRASRASQPTSFAAERVDVDTCRITASTVTDEPLLLRYGESAPTFYYRMEAVNIEPQSDGSYKQEADVNNLGSGQISFLVEGHEDSQTTCDPFTGSAGSEDSDAGSDPLLDGPASSPQLTTPAETEPDETPTPTDPASVSKTALDQETADAYFDDNSNADAVGCFNEFKDDYYGVVQMCNQAWRNK